MSKHDFSNKKLYNGMDCHEGMKVAPFVVENKSVAIEIGVKAEYIETYHLPGGKKYLVSFIEVPEDEFEDYMANQYNQQIRDFFDDYGNNTYKEQFSRCVINGEVCPMYKHCSSCKEVDSDGKPLRDKKVGMMSLDPIIEEGHEPSVESDIETNILFEELLEAAAKIKDYYPLIIKRTRDGYKPAEFIDELPVKKSQGYTAINDALAFVKDYLK